MPWLSPCCYRLWITTTAPSDAQRIRGLPRPELAAECGDRQRSVTMGRAKSHQLTWKWNSMAIVTLGIDLANNACAVHAADVAYKPALVRPNVLRAKLLELLASLLPCLIGMDACSGARTTGRACLPHTPTPCG